MIYSLRLIFVSTNYIIQRSENRNDISSEKTMVLQKLYYATVGTDVPY